MMNGRANRGPNGAALGRPPLPETNQAPRGQALVESYRPDALNDFAKEKPRYNPMNAERTQSSMLVDLKDPVQVHLLTETALYDSKEYEILSQEEVDELKKQVQLLSQRIDQTRANLAIQSKYRDAAISMSKLYSPGKRKSLLGNRGSGGSDAAREAEAEREMIERKCEDLASELWNLEKRMMDPQRRLLEHTAGILQLTHKTTKGAGNQGAKAALVNGVPASPESMYTTSNGRDSIDATDDMLFFDDASMYRSFENFDAFGGLGGKPRANPIEIPQKSPVREQNKQLVEESERLREEKGLLLTQSDSLKSELESLRTQSSDTERKLERFNNQLRNVIVMANPTKNGNYRAPPSGQLEPGDLINSQLDYLEKGLVAVQEGQSNNSAAAEMIQALNLQIQDVLLDVNPSHPSPPDAAAGLDDQVAYLRDSLRTVEDELQRAADLSTVNSTDKQKSEQVETVLMGLWEIIQSGYADINQRKQERRKTRMDKGLEPDDEDMSDTEAFDPEERYSLQGFSTKVQWLYAQATSLKEQKGVLKRQVKQQRELNSKSDGEKDQALKTKVDELEQTRGMLDKSEKEADTIRAQLSTALGNLEQSQTQLRSLESSRSEDTTAINDAQKALKERNAKIASLETSNQDAQARLTVAEASIATITAQLQEANNAKSAADKQVADKTREAQSQQEELDRMTGMYAELKMEATLAKAELDGAYGTRRERAAEVAALSNNEESSKMKSRIDELEPKVERLTAELTATANILEDMTKQALNAENKIVQLEDDLDKAQKDKEHLQSELDREKLKPPGSPSLSKPTEIITDRYREQLKGMRQKHAEDMKAIQMALRRAEDENRAMKRAQGPGKSPLSPR